MPLSIVNGKVQLRSDNGLWYEFGLIEEDDRVYHGDITEVLVEPVGADEKAVLLADNGNLYDVILFTEDTGTPDERTYLDIVQTPSSDPITDDIELPLGDAEYKMILEEFVEDGRIYYDWSLVTVPPPPPPEIFSGGLSTFIRPSQTRSRYRVGV